MSLVYLAALVKPNELSPAENAFLSLPALIAVRDTSAASDTGFNPPWSAAAPANTTSSRATLAITPKVYPEFNTKLSKLARVPSLLVLPILIASSISVAEARSGAPGSPPNISAIDL